MHFKQGQNVAYNLFFFDFYYVHPATFTILIIQNPNLCFQNRFCFLIKNNSGIETSTSLKIMENGNELNTMSLSTLTGVMERSLERAGIHGSCFPTELFWYVILH